jgi:hypothetical protein
MGIGLNHDALLNVFGLNLWVAKIPSFPGHGHKKERLKTGKVSSE